MGLTVNESTDMKRREWCGRQGENLCFIEIERRAVARGVAPS